MGLKNQPRIHWAWWLLGIVLLLAWQFWPRDPSPSAALETASGRVVDGPPSTIGTTASRAADPSPDVRLPAFLPAEAHDTIALIQRGGPFPHRQDGGVFGNREGHLPRKPRGWYREYTVETPRLSHRGARRIITGGNPPETWYYTSDHYDSFRGFDPGPSGGAVQ